MGKPTLSPKTIRCMVQSRRGAVSDFEALQEGLVSQAFRFRQGTSHYVVRINRFTEGFRRDEFVYRRFAGAALPIPEVLEIGRLDERHAFCISRLMPGVRLYDVDRERVQQLVNPMLDIMEVIAGADLGGTDGFGSFDVTGVGTHTSWQNYLLSIVDPMQMDWNAVAHLVPMPIVELLCSHVVQRAGDCPKTRQLIHGDLGSYNVLIDSHKISALLDWDRALYGDALYDVSGLLFWQEDHLNPLTAQIVRRGRSNPFWRERVFCYQLRIGLQELYESATGLGPVNIDWLIERCRTIIEQY